jgi:hypothetical protein
MSSTLRHIIDLATAVEEHDCTAMYQHCEALAEIIGARAAICLLWCLHQEAEASKALAPEAQELMLAVGGAKPAPLR